ncbi:phosphatase PAP2 family protein, partial [bacterium]|nr:phosphatase PAP2 family protein [Candidatus Elulimicrobium humile]
INNCFFITYNEKNQQKETLYPYAETIDFKQPPITTQLTSILTQSASSQRISPLTAARIQAYVYLASYLAYKNSTQESKDASAIKAASVIAKELYFNVPVITTSFDTLSKRYNSSIDNEAINSAIKLVRELINKDRYNQVKMIQMKNSNNIDEFTWIPTGISQRSFMDPNYGDLNLIAELRDICKLPAPDRNQLIKEVKTLFDNFDISKSNNIYVTTFLAGVGTPTPPGQNLQIITTATVTSKLPTDQALRIITASALAIFDTSILTWYEKRLHNIARPETLYYNLTKKRIQLARETPAHPSYPSGHSAFSGANAAIIEQMISDQIQLSLTLPDDIVIKESTINFLNPEDFTSKVNQSRVDAGFHYPMDVKAGEALGRCVGNYYAKNFDEIINKL